MHNDPSEQETLKAGSNAPNKAELKQVAETLKKNPLAKEAMVNGKKVRVVSVDELKRFATRLGKISQFYFIGAILMLMAGVHFAEQGSQLLPKIFLGVLVFCVLMTLLSFRISYKAEKVVNLIGKNLGKK